MKFYRAGFAVASVAALALAILLVQEVRRDLRLQASLDDAARLIETTNKTSSDCTGTLALCRDLVEYGHKRLDMAYSKIEFMDEHCIIPKRARAAHE